MFLVPPFRFSGSAYAIAFSGLFNGTSSQATYTPSTARTDGTKFTITFGVQRGKLDSSVNTYRLFTCVPGAHTLLAWYLDSLYVQINDSGAARMLLTTQKFRDPTAFLPVTVTFDRGAATAAEKLRLYIGLDEVTDFSTDQRGSISGFADPNVMANGMAQFIGRRGDMANAYIHDALADFRIIDGQALGPENFWEQDATTGNWVPKEYTGTYGNNGVYLPDLSTGTDDSGNGHDFSPTDISQVTSTPTNVFWSFNAVHEDRSGTLSNGNRTVSGTVHQVGTLAMDGSVSLAWKVTDAGSGGDYGIELAGGAQTETTYTASASDVLEFEFDGSNLDVRVNGGSATSVATGLSGTFVPLCKAPCTITQDFTPADSAFKALTTDNLPAQTGSVGDVIAIATDAETDIESTLDALSSGWTKCRWLKNRDSVENWLIQFDHDSSNEYIGVSGTRHDYQAKSTLSGTDNWVGYDFRIGSAYGTAAGSASHTNGSATTVTHNLGSTDVVIMLFRREATGIAVPIYHPDLTSGDLVYLSTTSAETADTAITNVQSNSFDIGSGEATDTYDYLVLAAGDFCKIGSHEGNGNADGPFVNLMGAPEWVMFKDADTTSAWTIYDAVRSTFNEVDEQLLANTSAAETTGSEEVDFIANGVKQRSADAEINASGSTFIYLAFVQPNGPTENHAR